MWRELRRLEQDAETKEGIAAAKAAGVKYERPVKSFLELKAEKPQLEVARIAADSGSWSMFISAMGGLFCPRNNQPLRLIYKPHENKYGEAVSKLKGITNKIDLTMISRADGWVIGKKGSESALDLSDDNRAPWSSVNNCTEPEKDPLKEVVADHLERQGIKWDMGGVNAIARGDSIHTSDGRKIRLSNIGSGIQLLVEDTYDEPNWEGWDVPISKPVELTYSERIKAVPCHATGRPDYNRDYWERKEIL